MSFPDAEHSTRVDVDADEVPPDGAPGVDDTPAGLSLPRSRRLKQKRDFTACFNARNKYTKGPLAGHARPNGLKFSRIGIVIGRRVGTAVARNRIKRLIREAFRLDQHQLPSGWDVVIVVRPHEPDSLENYRVWLGSIIPNLAERWAKKHAKPQNTDKAVE